MISLLRKVKVEPGGVLLLAALVFFSDSDLLIALMLNVVIHECGHIIALRYFGVYIRRISVNYTGLCIVCNQELMNIRQRFICSFAGPCFGMGFSCLASLFGNLLSNAFLCLFAGVGVILSLFNLMPIIPLDGGRMLETVAPNIAQPVSVVCAVMLECVGLYIMYKGYGTALALLGYFLLLWCRK